MAPFRPPGRDRGVIKTFFIHNVLTSWVGSAQQIPGQLGADDLQRSLGGIAQQKAAPGAVGRRGRELDGQTIHLKRQALCQALGVPAQLNGHALGSRRKTHRTLQAGPGQKQRHDFLNP